MIAGGEAQGAYDFIDGLVLYEQCCYN